MTTARSCPTCGYARTYDSDALADAYFPRHSCKKHQRRRPTTCSCPKCGYTRTYLTGGLAEQHFPRHSCARHQHSVEMTRQHAQRAAGGPRRDCQHPGHPHQHGSRTAYVRDTCRCRPCMTANTAASRDTARKRAMGCWEPYVDANPLRQHIQALRDSGLGRPQIAKLAGISASHLSSLIKIRPDGTPVIARVRPITAHRILAVRASDVAAGARIDATGTRRRLQALTTNGWPLAALAHELGRPSSRLAGAMVTSTVYPRTAQQIAELYDRIGDNPAPQDTPGQRAASEKAREYGRLRGWLPPAAWDDIDTDPEPAPEQAAPDNDIDEIAVERAVAGDDMVLDDLTRTEQIEAVRRLTDRGRSIRDIADQLATTTRTISRRRVAAGNGVTVLLPHDGSDAWRRRHSRRTPQHQEQE